MKAIVILAILTVTVLAIPARIKQRYVLPDESYSEMFATTNPTYAGGLFLTTTTGNVAYIASGQTQPVNILSLGSRSATPPADGIIGAIAVHPTKDLLYVAYSRDPTAEETAAYRIMDGAVPRNPTYIGTVAEFKLTATTADTERVILTYPAFDSGVTIFPEIAFGADGFLYISSASALWRNQATMKDPNMLGSLRDNLYAKILRINVDVAGRDRNTQYGVPSDNPWGNIAGVREEVYATGFSSAKDFTWVDGALLAVDENDEGIADEINNVGKGLDYGFNKVTGNGACYILPNCTATGEIPKAQLPVKGSATGLGVYNNRIYVGTATAFTWYSKDFTTTGDVTLMDAEGYAASTRYPNFFFTDVLRHTKNGTLFVIGSGEAKKSIVFSFEEDTSAAAVSVPAVVLLMVTLLIALFF
jgi:hypothetical protein